MPTDSKHKKNKIFINYRRSDVRGYAGRIEDSLKNYFGQSRVFRDVSDMTPSEDFTKRIENSVAESGAMIVLIGPNWLQPESETGRPRIFDADDFVAGEIEAALNDSDVKVFPVLIEGATMPREEELPDRINGLSRCHGITVDDERWSTDVLRLAQVIGLDVSGTEKERRLEIVKVALMSILLLAIFVSTFNFALMANDVAVPVAEVEARKALAVAADSGDLSRPESEIPWFAAREAAVSFIAIFLCVFILLWARTWVDRSRRHYIHAALAVGTFGGMSSYLYYLFTNKPYMDSTHIVMFAASTMIITAMLALLAMSGFKPNDGIE